jgi:hypothetical protein
MGRLSILPNLAPVAFWPGAFHLAVIHPQRFYGLINRQATASPMPTLATCQVPRKSCPGDGSIHFVCTDWRHLDENLTAGKRTYHELKNLIAWVKTNAGIGTFYRSQHELIFVWKHGRGKHTNNFELGQHGRHRSNVWTYAGANAFSAERLADLAIHPTVKPVALVADAIRDCSRRGDLVLDSFGGSGTTLIACERTGRKARLIEIDPIYCDQAVRRWQKLTGRNAVNAAGVPFNDVESRGPSHETQC